MNRHRPSALVLLGAAAVGLLACSSDSGASTTRSGSTPDSIDTTSPDTTPDTVVTTGYPSGADDLLVSLGRPGDLVPHLVIGGDGWVYFPTGEPDGAAEGLVARPVADPGAIPAPQAPAPTTRRLLTPAGLATVMALAAEHGLLTTPPDYADPGVTDHETTRVIVADLDGTYVHDAYALGFDDETGARRDLLEFADALGDIERLVGSDEIGSAELYEPDTYSVTIDGAFFGQPYDLPWPAGVPLDAGCVALPVAQFPEGVAGLYVAATGSSESHLAVVPDLPGDDC